jgi:hypothetical protein
MPTDLQAVLNFEPANAGRAGLRDWLTAHGVTVTQNEASGPLSRMVALARARQQELATQFRRAPKVFSV